MLTWRPGKMELRGIKLLLLWSILVLSANVATGKKKKKLEIIVEVGRMERSCPILYCMLDPFASYYTQEKPEDCLESEIAHTGDVVTVHYTGSFENGQVFDTSRQAGREPFKLRIGAGQVIKGWEEGLQGMCVGEVRKLVIPPHLAYGEQGVSGAIPPDATLIFSVELLAVEKPPIVNIPTGGPFWLYVGIVGLAVLGAYELYRRATAQGEELKQQKKARAKKKK